MAVSSVADHDIEPRSTITQLVDAEQRWRDELARADRECASLVDQAREAIADADRALQGELASMAEQRRRELTRDIDARIASIRAEAHQRAARLQTIAGNRLRALVDRVLERVFWAEDSS